MTRCSTSSGSPVRIPSRRASSAVAAAAAIVPGAATQHEPGPGERLVQRPVRRSAVMTASAHRARARRDLDGDRLVVGAAQPAQVDHRLAQRDAEAGGLVAVDGRMTRVSIRERRDAPAPEHLLGERHQPVGPAVRRRLGHEAAATGLAVDEAVLGQALHRVPGGHPADPELGAQLGVGWQPIARCAASRSVRAVPARSGGSAAGRRRRSSAGCRLRAVDGRARSRRPTCPSSAVTISTSLSDVVRTRRLDLGPDRVEQQRPAAAIPPPMTTRSGEMTVIMLPIPIPR